MTIFNDTNQKRVEKIVEIVSLLEKSTLSNKASNDDVWQLLEPAINALQELLGEDPPEHSKETVEASPGLSEGTKKHNPDSQEPVHLQLKRLAEECPVEHISMIMAVVMTRFDDMIYERQKKRSAAEAK